MCSYIVPIINGVTGSCRQTSPHNGLVSVPVNVALCNVYSYGGARNVIAQIIKFIVLQTPTGRTNSFRNH